MPAVDETLQTARFGKVAFKSTDVVGFDDGIPGFEHLKRFLLIENSEFEPIKFFQAVDDPNISFPLLPPQAVRSNYHFELPTKERRHLELEKEEEAAVFCMVTIDEDPTKSTINLFAPVVINLLKRKAAQVILFGTDYKVDSPLLNS